MLIKLLTSGMILLFTSCASFAQKTNIQGKYLLVKIEEEGQTTPQNQIVDFKSDGNFFVQDIPFGTWKLNDSNIIFDAKKIAGTYHISHNKQGLTVLKNKNKSLFFKKLHYNKILINNNQSELIGTWERMDTIDGAPIHEIIKFQKPDSFKLVTLEEGTTTSTSGTWLLFPQKKQLLLVGRFEGMQGKNTNLKYDTKSLYFENGNKKYLFHKVKKNSIIHLNFSEADFYDADGNYKYESDADKLPWKTPYQYYDYLKNLKNIQYQFSKYIPESKSFETKVLTENISTNSSNDAFHIDYIYNGYDRYHLPDDTALRPNNYDPYKSLYPYNQDTFRIVGVEKINVPAGSFTCTVVEATAGMDDKIKLWLINDKPGVFAKIIIETPGKFGKYWQFALSKITKQ